jgi:hypothetical protein
VEEAMAGVERQHAVLFQKEGGHTRARLAGKKIENVCFDVGCEGSIRLEPGMKVREEKNCKKSPFAFVVETPVNFLVCCFFSCEVVTSFCSCAQGRQYVMYPANKSSQENSAWEKAINNVLSPSSSSKPASNVPQVQSLSKMNSAANNNNTGNARQDDKFRYEKIES